ncbi:hypothetical protein UFOVP602_27 [uncultured Caudovirales phage]|uniref:Uncharacterized protein n=1 Tax=uncultured Caudovirales phage TaxID=2100421 RepID=A0A6J5N185_9CAUD|nr:hypothetical protein UFOVP602_27 [uncultured Caudovirales phage]
MSGLFTDAERKAWIDAIMPKSDANGHLIIDWKYRDHKNRQNVSDMVWLKMQPKPEDAQYIVGDIVMCLKSGNIGIVVERSNPRKGSGWPVQYACDPVPGGEPLARHAWFCDLDIEMVEPSASRKYAK